MHNGNFIILYSGKIRYWQFCDCNVLISHFIVIEQAQPQNKSEWWILFWSFNLPIANIKLDQVFMI